MALRRIAYFIFFTSLLLISGRSFADIGPGQTASLEQERFEEHIRAKETEARLKKKEKPEIQVAEEAAAPAKEAQEIPFFVEKINVEESGLLGKEVRELVAPYENKETTLSEIRKLTEKITELYRSRGYITCRAYIPPQSLETNTLTIKVLEGRIGEVKVQGNRFSKKENVSRFVDGLKNKILQYEELKRNLMRANFHPDREVKAVIIPGKDLGTSDLLLDVKDTFPLHIGGEINNYGTKLTGEERYSVFARHTNLLGWDDILAARVQFGEEVFALGTQYVLPLGPFGTELGASFNYTEVAIGREFEILDIEGTATSWKVFLNQPVWDSEYVDLTWTGAFESKTIDNTVLDLPSSRDDLRMWRTGLNMDEIDPWGRTFVVNEFTFGVPYFGASDKNDPRLSREGAGASFFKYNGALNRIHPVYDSTHLYLKATAQFTPDRLLSAEQVDIGGVYSVRGYPQSDYLADYGAGWSAELRMPCYLIGRDVKIPWTDQPLWNKINFIGFIDGAYAKLRRPAPGDFESKNFMGAGGGVRVDLPRNLNARFEWAAPLGDRPSDGSDSQFYFSVSVDLP